MMKSLILITTFVVGCFCSHAQSTAPSAEKLLSAAYKQARKEDKNVFILFHASWCGWCHKMDASMNDSAVAKFFTDNYVIVHLTVEETANKKNMENEGGFAFKLKYHGATAGLPFWLIMNNKRNLLADSQVRPAGTPITAAGSNIGCPAGKNEVQFFIDVLKKTSRLDDKALATISKVFSRNILR